VHRDRSAGRQTTERLRGAYLDGGWPRGQPPSSYNESMSTGVEAPAQYAFKPTPYSSHSLLLRQLPTDGHNRRVLDVGCASGYLTDLLAARGFHVTAIDLHDAAPAGAAAFHRADLDLGLPPLNGPFDFIVCADVLEHLRDPLRLLLDMRALLAPDGALLLSLPNSGHWYFRANVLAGRFPQDDRGLFDRTHLHFFTWSGWVGLLDRAGLRIEAAACSADPYSEALPRWKDSLAVRALERLSYEAARLWKRMFAYQFIVRARRA
jgi:SAM-dependent methyltransferase